MAEFSKLLGKEEFRGRHIGPDEAARREMLGELGVASLDALIDEVVPRSIRLSSPLALGEPATELHATTELSAHAMRNEIWRTFIGMGYYGTYTPAVIQRNVMENPGWYTAYTPYQAEISQGRLEALLNFQQMVIDLTGLPVANASLLDEATAAAEAMTMIRRSSKSKAERLLRRCRRASAGARGDAHARQVARHRARRTSWIRRRSSVPISSTRTRSAGSRTGLRSSPGCTPPVRSSASAPISSR